MNKMENISKNKTIKEAIVEAIAFFDLFSFPLTALEVLKYSKMKSSYEEVLECLCELKEKDIIKRSEGLYFLPERDEIVSERKKRYNYSDRKFKKAIRVAKIFRFIPWVRMICVANLIGRDNLRDGSDIDLFIVTDHKKIWLSRFFLVAIAKFLNVRPQKNNQKDKICLSFFISEKNTDLSGLKKEAEDRYFDYWFLNLAPIYSRDNSFIKFIESNQAIMNKFPNYYPEQISDKRKIKIIENSFYKNNWNLFFGGLEERIKSFQLKIIPNKFNELAPLKKGVIMEDNIIKLHLNDRREEFSQKYNENISKIKI